MRKILFYGYGNPGRQDDGLGISFIENLQNWTKTKNITNIFFDSNYQLNIEDADTIAQYDIVIFVDASEENIEDFCVTEVEPAPEVNFTMHSTSPGFVLNLCKEIKNKMPQTYLIHIKGYQWEFQKALSSNAQSNLAKALMFIKNELDNAARDRTIFANILQNRKCK